MSSIDTLTTDSINEIIGLQPDLRASILAALDEKIKHYADLRSAVGGEAPIKAKRGRPKKAVDASSSATPNINKMKHREAVLKVLEQAEFKGGATSRQLRLAAQEKLGHAFGASLGTTLNNMSIAKQVKYKPVEKGSKQFLYLSP